MSATQGINKEKQEGLTGTPCERATSRSFSDCNIKDHKEDKRKTTI